MRFLVDGLEVLYDEQDHRLVASMTWRIQKQGKKHRYAFSGNKAMHRLISKAKHGEVVDHVNGNGLDNRRDNLRVCTHTENMRNRRSVCGTVPFKGVYQNRDGRKKKFVAEMRHNGRNIYIGAFYTELEAAIAYDAVCEEMHGEFAVTNESLGLISRRIIEV